MRFGGHSFVGRLSFGIVILFFTNATLKSEEKKNEESCAFNNFTRK